jgi:hypothetical protein
MGCGDSSRCSRSDQSAQIPGQIRGATCQFPAGGLKKDVLTGSGSVPVRASGASAAMLPSHKGWRTPPATVPALMMTPRDAARAAKPIPQGGGNRYLARRRQRYALPERADSRATARSPAAAPSRPTTVGVHVRGGSRVSIEAMRKRPRGARPLADRSRLPRSEFSIRFPHRQLGGSPSSVAICGAGRAAPSRPS